MAFTITSLNSAATVVGSSSSDSLTGAEIAAISALTLNAYEADDVVNLTGGIDLDSGTIGMGGGSDQVIQANTTEFADVTVTLGDSTDIFTAGDNITTSSIKGQGGADTLSFEANGTTLDAVFVNGNQGRDIITIGGGNDVSLNLSSIVGGSEDDIFTIDIVNGGTTAVNGGRINGQEGDDTITVDAGHNVNMTSTTLFGGNGSDVINASAAVADTRFRISGDLGNDTLTGASASVVDTPGDRIFGGNGNDTIAGGAAGALTGADTLSGGDGDDTFVFGLGAEANTSMAGTFAGLVWAVGDTIVLGGGGVNADILNITDFASGDRIDSANGTAAVSGLGATAGAAQVGLANTTYYFSGTYNQADSTFTITANNLGTDTLVFLNGGAANDTALLLKGTNSSALTSTTFI